MNRVIFLFFLSFLCADINLYWDLGLGTTNFQIKNPQTDLITLSTFNRIEGLKKYYNHDFEGAIYHFSQLESNQQAHILYEYAHSYCMVNKFNDALTLLNNISSHLLTENLIYLKSKTLTTIGNYNDALLHLEELKQDFPHSEYIKIIQFEIEKINLLAK